MSQKLSVTTSNARRRSRSRSWRNLAVMTGYWKRISEAATEAYAKLESLACVKDGTLGIDRQRD